MGSLVFFSTNWAELASSDRSRNPVATLRYTMPYTLLTVIVSIVQMAYEAPSLAFAAFQHFGLALYWDSHTLRSNPFALLQSARFPLCDKPDSKPGCFWHLPIDFIWPQHFLLAMFPLSSDDESLNGLTGELEQPKQLDSPAPEATPHFVTCPSIFHCSTSNVISKQQFQMRVLSLSKNENIEKNNTSFTSVGL